MWNRRECLAGVGAWMVGAAGAPSAWAQDGASLTGLSADDARWINRLTWGLNDSSAKAWLSAGRAAWVESQLKPQWPPTLPAPVQAQIDALEISRTPFAEQARQLVAMRQAATATKSSPPDKGESPQDPLKAWRQAMLQVVQQASARRVLRSVYAKEQLQDQLGWFWFNHFNIFAHKQPLMMMVGDFDDALRPHALGRFRDLLGAAVLHPAMLHYLDNDRNAVGRINENLGRELLELHTLGVDGGYTQDDVQALAAVLTGLGVSYDTEPPKLKPELRDQFVQRGLMVFHPARHDFSDKKLLGDKVAGGGLAEIEGVLDKLARHPATARHVVKKLALFMLGTAPSDALVQKLAERFLASDGRIADVLRVLLGSTEFQASLNRSFKDPVHYVVSALRAAYDGQVIQDTLPAARWLNQLGQAHFARQTPDGYPLEAEAWNGSGQLTARFEIARMLVNAGKALGGTAPPAAALVAKPRAAVFEQVLKQGLSAGTRGAMAEAANAREADALWLSSPEFMVR